MKGKHEIWIFYSESTEPELISFYSQGISYLQESNIKTHVVDVDKNPREAVKHNIFATPVLIIKKGKEISRYIGIVDGLKQLLESDLYGRTVLHTIGFKEGRILIRGLDLSMGKRAIEEVLKNKLSSRGIREFKLIEFDSDKMFAKVSLIYDLAINCKTQVCGDVAAFLGGIFTEIFGRGVMARETQCMARGNSFCEFEIGEIHQKDENVAEMVERAIG